jgi:hypothetical protein
MIIKIQVIIMMIWFFTLISRASFIFSLIVVDRVMNIMNINNIIIEKPIFQAMGLNEFHEVFFWFASIIHGRKRDIIETIVHIRVIFDDRLKFKLLNLKSWYALVSTFFAFLSFFL